MEEEADFELEYEEFWYCVFGSREEEFKQSREETEDWDWELFRSRILGDFVQMKLHIWDGEYDTIVISPWIYYLQKLNVV